MHDRRDAGNGYHSHHARLASVSAAAVGIITKDQLKIDQSTYKAANRAKHGKPWADVADDPWTTDDPWSTATPATQSGSRFVSTAALGSQLEKKIASDAPADDALAATSVRPLVQDCINKLEAKVCSLEGLVPSQHSTIAILMATIDNCKSSFSTSSGHRCQMLILNG